MCFDFRPWLAWNCCFQQLEINSFLQHECFVKEKKHLAFVYVRACVSACVCARVFGGFLLWSSRGIVTLTTRILSTIVVFQYCCVTTPPLTINRLITLFNYLINRSRSWILALLLRLSGSSIVSLLSCCCDFELCEFVEGHWKMFDD
jgi:hypothetical protein